MLDRNKYTGNKTDSPDLLKVLLTLKDNIMKDTYVAEVCQVIEIKNGKYKVIPLCDNKQKFQCYKLADVEVQEKDIVLVIFNNTSFASNLEKIQSDLKPQNLDEGTLHSSNYGIIAGSFTRGSGGGSGDFIPQGGTLTAPLTVQGGDSITSGKIRLNQNQQGQITDSGTATLFGFLNNSNLTIGHSTYNMKLRGKETRPDYNGNDLALLSDVPSSDGFIKTTNEGTQTIATTAASGDPSETPLFLKSNANGSYIGFKNSAGSNLGWFGVNQTLKPIFWSINQGAKILATLDSAYPVGSIYISTNNTSPASLFGGSWNALTEGYVLQTTTTANTGGDLIPAGLPNITGQFRIQNAGHNEVGYTSGAFSFPGHGGDGAKPDTSVGATIVNFDANSGASVQGIYGNSNTVQPKAIKCYMWERVS